MPPRASRHTATWSSEAARLRFTTPENQEMGLQFFKKTSHLLDVTGLGDTKIEKRRQNDENKLQCHQQTKQPGA